MEKVEDIRQICEIQYELLKKFADYCDAHQLRYNLTGGTLLGAVRHKGFIPWDDDVDVAMPRPDYERFLKISGGKLDEYTEVSVFENNVHHSRLFMRVVDNRTLYRHKYYQSQYEHHLGIDVFPIDGVPSNKKERKKYFRQIAFWKQMFSLSQSAWGKSTNPFRAVAKTLASIPARIMGRNYIYQKVMKIVEKYPFEDSQLIGITTGVYLEKEVCKKTDFYPECEVEFEECKFKAPGCIDKYLKGLYGDYMQLPPEEKRIRKHSFEVYRK